MPVVKPNPTAYRRGGCEKCGEAHLLCTAHNRRGTACGEDPMAGTTVCYYHGGESESSKENARLRILCAADPAAAEMIRLLRHDDWRARFKAAADLLDRGGLGAKKGVEVTGPDGEPVPVELRAQGLAEALRAFQAGVEAQASLEREKDAP